MSSNATMPAQMHPADVPEWMIDGTLAKAEREALVEALLLCNYRVSDVSKRLRVGRTTVYRLTVKYQIEMAGAKRGVPRQR